MELLDLLRKVEPHWVGFQRAFKHLSDSAVVIRYPGKKTTRADAKEAYETCTRLRALARSSLGLKP